MKHTFTITLYRSRAISVIVHIEVHPQREPTMAYISHISGPEYKIHVIWMQYIYIKY